MNDSPPIPPIDPARVAERIDALARAAPSRETVEHLAALCQVLLYALIKAEMLLSVEQAALAGQADINGQLIREIEQLRGRDRLS